MESIRKKLTNHGAGLAIKVGIKIKTKLGDNSLHSVYFMILTTFLDSLPLQTYQ